MAQEKIKWRPNSGIILYDKSGLFESKYCIQSKHNYAFCTLVIKKSFPEGKTITYLQTPLEADVIQDKFESKYCIQSEHNYASSTPVINKPFVDGNTMAYIQSRLKADVFQGAFESVVHCIKVHCIQSEHNYASSTLVINKPFSEGCAMALIQSPLEADVIQGALESKYYIQSEHNYASAREINKSFAEEM